MDGELESTAIGQRQRGKLLVGFAEALGDQGGEAGEAIERFVTHGDGELPGETWLLGWDANSVHGYVFGTGNAMAIRGASKVLKELDEDTKKGEVLDLRAEQILYAGGGGGIAVVSREQAEWLPARLHELFAKRSRVATCSVAKRAIDGSPFGEQVGRLRRAMARERALDGPDPEGPVPFFARLCEVCGWRAAAGEPKRGEGAASIGRAECEACRLAIERGKEDTDNKDENLQFDDIASSDGLLGVVYLDGNGIGNTISGLQAPLAYACFSEAIEELFRRSFEGVRRAHRLRDSGGEANAEPSSFQNPIAGGDDWILIVPGAVAVPLARDFLAALEEESDIDPVLKALGVGPIGAGAGVALGKKSMPIRQLIVESEELLKSAKQRIYAKRDGDSPVRSALDFGRVDDGVARRADSPAARNDERRSSLLLSGKPYSLDELRSLSERRPHWEAMPSSQLHSVLRVAASGPHQLRNYLLYQVARLSTWQTLAKALGGEGVLADPERLFDALVPPEAEGRCLEVGDLIELAGHWTEPVELPEKGNTV